MRTSASKRSSKYRVKPPAATDDGVAESRRPVPFPWSENEDIPLPDDYMPTKHDVINGRGRRSYNHIANIRFRQLIGLNLDRYLVARCKVEKSLIVVGIVNTIRQSTPVGAFLKRCPKTGCWISLSDESAREKVGHCLRDMIAAHRSDEKKALMDSKKKNISATQTESIQTTIRSEHSLSSRGDHHNHPVAWVETNRARESPRATNNAQLARMWYDITNSNDHAAKSSFPPLPDPPQTPRLLMDMLDMQNEALHHMSDQQRTILKKLETGFQGTVEELIQAAAK